MWSGLSDPPAVIARVEGLRLSPQPGPSFTWVYGGKQLAAVKLSGCLEAID